MAQTGMDFEFEEELTEVTLYQRVKGLNVEEARARLVQEELVLQNVAARLRGEESYLANYSHQQAQRDEMFQRTLHQVGRWQRRASPGMMTLP